MGHRITVQQAEFKNLSQNILKYQILTAYVAKPYRERLLKIVAFTENSYNVGQLVTAENSYRRPGPASPILFKNLKNIEFHRF